MDYKQHKGNLRGQIKNQLERKLYNKRIRSEVQNIDTSEGQLSIPDVSLSVCTCNRPIVEKCILTDILFCMECISPMKTEANKKL
jgi:hypothetical protein